VITEYFSNFEVFYSNQSAFNCEMGQ